MVRARALWAVLACTACADEAGGDTDGATGSTTAASSSSEGSSSSGTTVVADSSSSSDGGNGGPKEQCGLPESGPTAACSGNVCFEHYLGAPPPGCKVDGVACADFIPGQILTGICNRAGEGTVFLYYYVSDALTVEELTDLQDASEMSCTSQSGIWCDIWSG